MLSILCTLSSITWKYIHSIQCIWRRILWQISNICIQHGGASKDSQSGVLLAFGQLNSSWCGRPPKVRVCNISGLWPPGAHRIHQSTMWPPHLHFQIPTRGMVLAMWWDEMVTILPLLKPLYKKNFRGKISMFLSKAKFLTNLLAWPSE